MIAHLVLLIPSGLGACSDDLLKISIAQHVDFPDPIGPMIPLTKSLEDKNFDMTSPSGL